jgi:hypothetical protein
MKPSSAAQRVSTHDANLVGRGGRIIHTLRIQPEAAEALRSLESKGVSATKIINELLIQAVKPNQAGG